MNTNRENFILLTDSYKLGHFSMYPEGTEGVYSYFESRKGAKYPYTVFFGLQMILKRYFEGVVITKEDIDEAEKFSLLHFGQSIFNKSMWEKIVKVYGGRLPILIKAVPEGLAVPVGNVMMTVESTDTECAPLTNVCETILTHLWHSSNVATISRDIHNFLEKKFEEGADNKNLLPFMLHDFGFRGVSSIESAGLGGSAHLINFKGTDTLIGITYSNRYYGSGMSGYSVPASEHSVMTSLGEDGEIKMVERLIEKYPKGILSVVSDSYSIENAIKNYGTVLRDKILERDGKFVVRPDSPRFKGDTAVNQVVWIAQELEKYFGSNTNSKGFKTLNPKIGIIYGDGLSVEEIKETVVALMKAGFSPETCVYGMGGGLLQKHNRDTQRSAFKCSAQKRYNWWFDIQKKPMDESKASKKGRLKLIWSEGSHGKTLITVPENSTGKDILVPVFHNGILLKSWSWNEVLDNCKIKTLTEAY